MSTIRVRVPSLGKVSTELQQALSEIDGNVAQVTAKVAAVSGVSWHPGDDTAIIDRIAQSHEAADRVNSSIATIAERLQARDEGAVGIPGADPHREHESDHPTHVA